MPRSSLYSIQEINERWNEQMLSIVGNSPIEANGMKIVFDHHPDIFFIPRHRSQKLRCAGFFIKKQLCGFAMMLYKHVFVDGRPQTILYFCNLVANRSSRGRGILYRMSDFFMKDLQADIQLGHAVIMRGNMAAKRLLNRFHPRYPNMPHSKIIGEWHVKNILLTPFVHVKPKYAVRHARLDDLDAIVHLLQKEYKTRLFGPVVTKNSILDDLNAFPNFGIHNYYVAESKNEIIGVCCAWDMAPVKKNRVIRYNRKMKRLKLLINLFAPMMRFPLLPSEGDAFRDVTILDYVTKERDPEILKALLCNIFCYYREKGYHLLIFGYPANDPISVAANSFFSREVVSEIIIFSKSKQLVEQFAVNSLPWIDMALL